MPRVLPRLARQLVELIRIVQVDSLNANGTGGGAGDVVAGGSGNLAEAAVGAALKYRAYAPVVDKLLQDVGLSQNGLAGLVEAAGPSGGTPWDSAVRGKPTTGPSSK